MSRGVKQLTGPLADGETGVHVVCADCPFEGLVVPLAAVDHSVQSRAGAIAREHAAAKRHRCKTLEVKG
jgi:hypothetical protein